MNKENEKEYHVLGLYTLRTIVILIGIWILKLILVSLPFFKELSIPDFPLRIIQIVNIFISFVVIAFLINFALGISKYWPLEFPKAQEAGTVFSMFILLIALIISYGTLKDVLEALIFEPEPVLILQIIFLLIAIVLLLRAALVVYQALPRWLVNFKKSITEPPDFKEK